MSKKIIIAFVIICVTLAMKVTEAQPPPPPPDPGLGNTHGWVGKSPVADGYGILLALGLAYGAWRLYRIKKNKTAGIN